MTSPWVDTANERHHTIGRPDPPKRNGPPAGRAQLVIRLLLALTIFGAVIPSDLYLANWFFGGRIHALRDPMVINSLVNLSVALAVPVIPLALLAILPHIRRAPHRQRQDW